MKAFQSALPGYQIHFVSKDCFDAIKYQCPEVEKKIYLYHHNYHNDLITTMSGILNRSYFCQKCEKGYSNKDRHFSNETCYTCHKCHKDWQYFSTCNRYFKNMTYFQLHAIVAVGVPPRWTETHRENRTCVEIDTVTRVKCSCPKITYVTWKPQQRKKQPSCLKENKIKGSIKTTMWENVISLISNARKTRWFSAKRATKHSSKSYVEIATNPTAIPILASKDTFQRRQFE